MRLAINALYHLSPYHFCSLYPKPLRALCLIFHTRRGPVGMIPSFTQLPAHELMLFLALSMARGPHIHKMKRVGIESIRKTPFLHPVLGYPSPVMNQTLWRGGVGVRGNGWSGTFLGTSILGKFISTCCVWIWICHGNSHVFKGGKICLLVFDACKILLMSFIRFNLRSPPLS